MRLAHMLRFDTQRAARGRRGGQQHRVPSSRPCSRYPDLWTGDREALAGPSRFVCAIGTTEPVLRNGAPDASYNVSFSSACGGGPRPAPISRRGVCSCKHPAAALQTSETRVRRAKRDWFIGCTGLLAYRWSSWGGEWHREWHRASIFKGFRAPPPPPPRSLRLGWVSLVFHCSDTRWVGNAGHTR